MPPVLRLAITATIIISSTLGFAQQQDQSERNPKQKLPAQSPQKKKSAKPAEEKPEQQPTPTPMNGRPQYDEALFNGMKWRQVGPFRGGRVLAVTGVPGDPDTFYFGG